MKQAHRDHCDRSGQAGPVCRTGATSALIGVLITAATLALPAPASAQDADQGIMALEEIVVTARRREERLQDTPVAVSAFTPESLERRQIFSTVDLDRVTPSLQFTSYSPLTGNNSAAQVFIRGIGQTDATSAVDPGVGIYVDEVYMGRAVGGAMGFRDVASVQVLRGPQGTLFGRNTIGGAVLISTNEPGDEFGGTLRGRVGSDKWVEIFGAVDMPVSDTLAGRFSAGMKKREGYVTRRIDGRDLGDDDTYTLQSSLRWEPTSVFTITVRGDYSYEDENGSPFVFKDINQNAVFPAAVSVGAGCPGATFPPPSVPDGVDERCANSDTWDLGSFENGGTADAVSTLKNWGLSAHMEWLVSDILTVKSITAYRSLTWTGVRDADNTPFEILTTDYFSDTEQVSQEIQALVETNRFSGVVGAFYFDEDTFDQVDVFLSPPTPLVLSGGPGSRDLQFIDLSTESWAAFTEWTYDLTAAFSVTGGIRYTREKKGFDGILTNVNPWTSPDPDPLPSTAPPLFVEPRPFSETFDAVTGSASLQYRWTDGIMTYASWSQGFKSGGFNQRYNAPPPNNEPISFDEENADTVEIGLKADIASNLRVNAALFHTTYDNIQLIYRLGIVPLLFNGGEARIQGAELEFTYVPTEDLIIEGGVSHLDDKIKSVVEVPGTTATITPDNSLPFTPSWKANVGVGYTFRPAHNLHLIPRVDITYTDSQFFDAANTVEVAQREGVTRVDASVSLENIAQMWTVTFGVNNVTDKLYPVAGNASLTTATGYAEIIYARPRNWFLSASLDF